MRRYRAKCGRGPAASDRRDHHLHGHANPAHERTVGDLLADRLARRRPRSRAVSISLSSDVSPRRREYERTSTVVANAYVKPIVGRFLAGLEAAFASRGFTGELRVMQSNGGLTTPALAREYPVNVIESGPAAGVLACRAIGAREGMDHVITFDMGGTTAKVGVIDGGEPMVTSTFEVDAVNLRKWSGLPLDVPAVELVEIGAGGGSIASARLGVVAVGPESAGAEPGPVCYGRGGRRATLTDANLVLGYLDPESFAGGQIRIDRKAAERATGAQVGEPLGLDPAAAAWGVHRIANADMERALRSMSIERGRDPRDYTMVAFGGAGPLHACALARALGVPRVVVPRGAGVASAIGLLEAERNLAVSLTRTLALDADAEGAAGELARLYAGLETRVRALAGADGGGAPVAWRRHAHLRYAGQGFELRVALPPGPIDGGYPKRVREAFDSAYEREYGYAQPDQPAEGTDWFLTGAFGAVRATAGAGEGAADAGAGEDAAGADTGTAGADADTDGDAGAAGPTSPGPGRAAPTGTVSAWSPGAAGWTRVPVFDRAALRAGDRLAGPAVVAEPESTLLLPAGAAARVSAHGNLVIDVATPEPKPEPSS